MTNVYLIRHGQSEYNAKRTKDLDSGLTELGRLQVELLKIILSDEIDSDNNLFIVSPYRRTKETYDILTKKISGLGYCEPNICEIRNTIAGFSELSLLKLNNSLSTNSTYEIYLLKGLELDIEFMDRMLSTYDIITQIIQQYSYDNIFVITHGMCCLALEQIHNKDNYKIPTWREKVDGHFIDNGKFIKLCL